MVIVLATRVITVSESITQLKKITIKMVLVMFAIQIMMCKYKIYSFIIQGHFSFVFQC